MPCHQMSGSMPLPVIAGSKRRWVSSFDILILLLAQTCHARIEGGAQRHTLERKEASYIASFDMLSEIEIDFLRTDVLLSIAQTQLIVRAAMICH